MDTNMGIDGRISYYGESVDPIDILRNHNITDVELYKKICKRDEKGFFTIDDNLYKYQKKLVGPKKSKYKFSIKKDDMNIENVDAKTAVKIIVTSISHIVSKTNDGETATIKGWTVWRV